MHYDIDVEWYTGYEHDTLRYVRVKQAVYNMEPIVGLWVSEEGKVYRTPHGMTLGTANELKPVPIHKARYPHIRWKIGVIKKNFQMHRLIACTFLPIDSLESIRGVPAKILQVAKEDRNSLLYLYNTLQVNHINHLHDDYSVKNLEWCTQRENTNAYHEHAGFIELREEKKFMKKVSEKSSIQIISIDKNLIEYIENGNLVFVQR